MFKPHRMKHVVVAGSVDLQERTIEALFDMRAIHLTDFNKDDPDFKMGTPLREAGPSSERLLKLRSAEKVLSVSASTAGEHGAVISKVSIGEVERDLDAVISKIDRDIMTKWESRVELDNQIHELARRADEIGPFSDMPLKLDDYEPFENLAILVGTVRKDPAADLEKAMGTTAHSLFKTTHKDGHLIAFFVERSKEEDASKVLCDHGFTELKPPLGKGLPKAHLANLTAQKDKLIKEVAVLDGELRELSKVHARSLLASEEHLRITVEKAEAPLRFATSPNAFVLEGFVPESEAHRLEEGLDKATDGRLYIEVSEPEKEDNIPVALNNPSPARPFEVLTNLVARPKYNEIDPSILMFIGMPLFFGLMLGDVGYAIVLIVCIGLGVMTRAFKFLGMGGAAPQLNAILMLCAISSFFFGILYNEFFGFEMFMKSGLEEGTVVVFPMLHYLEFTVPRILVFGPAEFPVTRFENVLPLLKLTIWIGVGHIFLGLCIGFRNKYVLHGLAHAIFEKGSWLLILTGGVIVFYFMLRDIGGFVHLAYAETSMVTGFVMLIVGCILLVKGEGAMGLIHLPSLISNTMSYARILAIGLSSTGIALAFNKMAIGIYDAGGAYIIAAGIVLFLGHFINILLGILGPTLHSLRLHYVEFFVKFYEGGGTPYSPFGMARRFTTKDAPKAIKETVPDTEPKLMMRVT